MREKKRKVKSKARKIVDIVFSVISSFLFAVILVCAVSIAVSKVKGQEANLFGYRFIYILTDSMEPALPKNASIIVRNCTAEDIKVGDFVTYTSQDKALDGSPVKDVTHKCIKELYYDEEVKDYCILTQGIKEYAPVDAPVLAENVHAKFICTTPVWVNSLLNFLLTPYGIAALICLPLVITLGIQLYSQIKMLRTPKVTDEEIRKQEVEKRTKKLTMQAISELESKKQEILAFMQANIANDKAKQKDLDAAADGAKNKDIVNNVDMQNNSQVNYNAIDIAEQGGKTGQGLNGDSGKAE